MSENHVEGSVKPSPNLSSTSFTAGTWRVAPASDYRGTEINIDAGERGLRAFICTVGQRGDVQAETDARLIAAAPVMHAALNELGLELAGLDCFATDTNHTYEAIGKKTQTLLPHLQFLVRAALAKSEGRS